MKCILCNSRKGKRHCPAKGTLICAPCCGRLRVVEIPCPADCAYLTSGHGHQAGKKYVDQLRQEEGRDRRIRLYENMRRYRPLIDEIEKEILRYGQGLSSFHDRHVQEAIRLLRKTYRSEERGVIYEHKSADPMVSALIRAVQEMLEKLRQEPRVEPQGVRYPELHGVGGVGGPLSPAATSRRRALPDLHPQEPPRNHATLIGPEPDRALIEMTRARTRRTNPATRCPAHVWTNPARGSLTDQLKSLGANCISQRTVQRGDGDACANGKIKV